MGHVIYGTLLECNHTEKSSTRKSNQTTLEPNKPQMCFEIWVWADPGAGSASCGGQVSVDFKKQTNKTQNKPLHPLTNLILPKNFVWLWLVINLFFPWWVALISFQWCSKIHPVYLPQSFKGSPVLAHRSTSWKGKTDCFSFFGPHYSHMHMH